MTQEPRQIPLLMRSEDLATWDNWLSRPETATLEQLLRGQVLEHSAYVSVSYTHLTLPTKA